MTGGLWALAIGALAILGALFKGLSMGRKSEKGKSDADTIDRMEKGRDAVRDGRDKPLDERLRDNDGQW